MLDQQGHVRCAALSKRCDVCSGLRLRVARRERRGPEAMRVSACSSGVRRRNRSIPSSKPSFFCNAIFGSGTSSRLVPCGRSRSHVSHALRARCGLPCLRRALVTSIHPRCIGGQLFDQCSLAHAALAQTEAAIMRMIGQPFQPLYASIFAVANSCRSSIGGINLGEASTCSRTARYCSISHRNRGCWPRAICRQPRPSARQTPLPLSACRQLRL
jgi:hypothetical protein